MPGLRTRTRMQVRVPQCSPRAHACSRSTMLHSHSPQGLENYRRSRTWTTLRRPHPVCRGKSLVRPRRRSWLTSDFGFFILSAAMNLPGRHTGNLNLIFMTARAMITPAGLAVLNSSLPSWFNVRTSPSLSTVTSENLKYWTRHSFRAWPQVRPSQLMDIRIECPADTCLCRGRGLSRGGRGGLGALHPKLLSRAEVRRSFITTTVRDESQVTPQGRHR